MAKKAEEKKLSVMDNLVAFLDVNGEQSTVAAIGQHYKREMENARTEGYQEGRSNRQARTELLNNIGGWCLGLLAVACVVTFFWYEGPHSADVDRREWLQRLSVCTNGDTVACMDAVRVQTDFGDADTTKREINVLKAAYREKVGKDLPVIEVAKPK